MRLPRMFHWEEWRNYVYPMLGKSIPSELLSYSRDEAEGKIFMDPFRRPSHISVPKKVKGTPSISSIQSGISADNVQKQLDMLQQSDTPLNVEDMATIVSGSFSLVGDDGSDEESIYEGRMMQKQRDSMESSFPIGDKIVRPAELAQKKKALHDKLQERSEKYKKTKELSEKKMALDSDSTEVEGLQLFRASYDFWKRFSGSGAKSSTNTPQPLVEHMGTSVSSTIQHPSTHLSK